MALVSKISSEISGVFLALKMTAEALRCTRSLSMNGAGRRELILTQPPISILP